MGEEEKNRGIEEGRKGGTDGQTNKQLEEYLGTTRRAPMTLTCQHDFDLGPN